VSTVPTAPTAPTAATAATAATSPQTPSAWASELESSLARFNADPTLMSDHLRSPDPQQQYLAFLNDIWTTTKPDSLNQVSSLLQAIQDLQANHLTPQHQSQAQQLAHKLSGTLGIFGLHKAVHLSRQLEHWLGSQDPLPPNQAALMHHLGLALHQTIQETAQIERSQLPQGHSPLMLLFSADDAFNQSLQAIAISRGIQVETVSLLELDTSLTATDAADRVGQPPDLIVLRLPAEPSKLNAADQAFSPTPAFAHHLQTCTQRYPALPIVVMANQIELRDRLEVARRGGKLLLDHSASAEQVIAAAVNLLKNSKLPTKVMIVDDDHNWLRTLPTLLKPWGFKVTTLADPQQFWTVLQAVTPDVLVLDVNLPEINGFELCQMLRSDPQWQRLPVLFLSALTDSIRQQQAFTVGADDYLCKPLMGGELANRILSRLQRVRAWAS